MTKIIWISAGAVSQIVKYFSSAASKTNHMIMLIWT